MKKYLKSVVVLLALIATTQVNAGVYEVNSYAALESAIEDINKGAATVEHTINPHCM